MHHLQNLNDTCKHLKYLMLKSKKSFAIIILNISNRIKSKCILKLKIYILYIPKTYAIIIITTTIYKLLMIISTVTKCHHNNIKMCIIQDTALFQINKTYEFISIIYGKEIEFFNSD